MHKVDPERLKGLMAWLESNRWWASVKAHVIAETVGEPWQSDCDCGSCDRCNLAYELSKQGLTAYKKENDDA